jgi:hypothetical protein
MQLAQDSAHCPALVLVVFKVFIITVHYRKF